MGCAIRAAALSDGFGHDSREIVGGAWPVARMNSGSIATGCRQICRLLTSLTDIADIDQRILAACQVAGV